MENKFYVYALIDPRDGKGQVFYVGKGKGSRSQAHLRHCINGSHYNQHLQNKINRIRNEGLPYGVEFLLSSDDEEACFEKEIRIQKNIRLE
jgi:hypothetical protein